MSEVRQRRLAVLIAEDSEGIRSAVTLCVQSLGHTVTAVATGREAIALLQEHYFDLIVTDVLMPDGDGIAVIEEAKKRYASTRILVMTGGGFAMDATCCVNLATKMGADAAILKPFSGGQFIAALNSAVPSSDTSAPFPSKIGQDIQPQKTA
jgi:CheY-like chemotaxis protein